MTQPHKGPPLRGQRGFRGGGPGAMGADPTGNLLWAMERWGKAVVWSTAHNRAVLEGGGGSKTAVIGGWRLAVGGWRRLVAVGG